MAFTAGYKVNEGTQYEFTVSNETIQEMVQASDSGIGEADLGPYCYSALIDSRVYQLRAAQGNFAWPDHTGADFAAIAKECCPGILEGWSEQLTSAHPAFNKELLDNSDVVYQRNFLVWEGKIYPGTENEKTGVFLVMDMVDIKRWYVNFDNAGFGTTNVESKIYETAPEGYVWPGYTGPMYTYAPNDFAWPVMHCDNNDPHLNPNTNIYITNILVVNDEYWIGSLNPGSGCQPYMGGSGCAYAGKSLYGWYWNGSSNGGYLSTSGMRRMYQRGSMDFMGLPDYSNAPELPGAPRNDIGSLNYQCYAVTDSDSIVVNLSGNWGQQNYASGVSFMNNSATTQLTSVLKWQSWCGLKFQYQDTMYKPIISGGVIVGYSDDMDAESEYDDMTNVTGNNIPIVPPGPAPRPDDDDPSDDQSWGGAYSGAGAFARFYLCSETDLANLRSWFGNSGSGGSDEIPDGFDPMGQIMGLLQYPISIAGTALAPEEITFRSGKTLLHTGVNADRCSGGFLHIDCGSVSIPRRMQERGVPFLDFESTLEVYVPFCGTAPLDVQACIGTTLKCDMYVATATGDVSAIVSAGGHPVAYMSGNMAESLPVSSSGYGMYLAACKSTWGNGVSQTMNQLTGGTVDTLKNTNQAALNETLSYSQTGGWGQSELIAESYNNPAVGKGMSAAASAKGVAAIGLITTGLNVANAASSSYEQYQRVKHASYTSVSGSFTSCAAWNYPFTPYVKITRPHKQIPTGGRGDYGHTTGRKLVASRALAQCPGLTVCINPDTSGIANATGQEKDIIYRALVNGVIV